MRPVHPALTPSGCAELSDRAQGLRKVILRMIQNAGSGHCGGSLSAIDIISYLFFHLMDIDPCCPLREDRDRFILGKGHCCPALYATLAARGYFPEDLLWTLRDIGTKLQGHPDMKKLPGVDMTTGSLGQSLSCGVGMALASRLGSLDFRTYCMMGDGELQSGQIWEAAMFAAHHRLENLIGIVDDNSLQSDGVTSEIVGLEPLADKWRAFGWRVYEMDGHDLATIDICLREAAQPMGRPSVVIAKTVKGKGVGFMENQVSWHGGAPTCQQLAEALECLEAGGVR